METLIAALGNSVDIGLAQAQDLIAASEAGEEAVEKTMSKALETAVAPEVEE
jgi:hypothetical protein